MIFALERLRLLRAGKDLDLPALTYIDDLPMDWRIDYEERAAILEYDAGLSRNDADSQALCEITERIDQMNNI